MKIYLAGKYEEKDKLNTYAHTIETSTNHTVTSRWLSSQVETFQGNALRDLKDIEMCNLLVHIMSEEPSSGRHFETGYAYALKKHIVTIGYLNGIFYFLPDIAHFDTFQQFIQEYL